MLNEKEFYRVIADVIRVARKQKGYTFEQLAGESEVDYSTVNSIENGRQKPQLFTLYRILFALDIDLTVLFQEKNKLRQKCEERIMDQIRLMPPEQKDALNAFLESYTILKK